MAAYGVALAAERRRSEARTRATVAFARRLDRPAELRPLVAAQRMDQARLTMRLHAGGDDTAALARDSLVAAQPARAGGDARRARPARRLERRRRRPARTRRRLERAVRVADRRRAHVADVDRRGLRARRLRRRRSTPSASGTRRRALFRAVPYGRNLFCSGHVQLPDGRTLLVGGHINAYRGARRHDALQRADEHVLPRRRTWPSRAGTRPRRSCRTAACSSSPATGSSRTGPAQPPPFSDASVNSLPELYNPTTNTWTSLTSGQLTTPLYPQLFVLSDGRIVDVGPDTTTRVLTPGIVDVVDRRRRARSTGTAPSCTGRTRS